VRLAFLLLAACFAAACSKPLEVEADAQREAAKWAAQQGWVAREAHCNPRFETKAGLWSCYVGDGMMHNSAAVFCTAGGCERHPE